MSNASKASKARRRRRNKTRAGTRAVAIRDVCDFVRSIEPTCGKDVLRIEEIAERIERHFAPAQAPE